MHVSNPVAPQYWHSLRIVSKRGSRKEHVAKHPSSYAAQLSAFVDAILRGTPFPTHVDDAIANMEVIDACYSAAGLAPRKPVLTQ
jgi:predicted dehydrogenase